MVKNLPAILETRVQSLGQQDSLEKGMATHSSILVGRVPRTEEPGGLQSVGHKESDTTERLTLPRILRLKSVFHRFFLITERLIRLSLES